VVPVDAFRDEAGRRRIRQMEENPWPLKRAL
jgi:hypothetical protein